MKRALSLILFMILVATFTPNVAAQDTSNAAPPLETLRVQLRDVQAKETELQARQKQLDEDLKPENIERSLAGVGSTRPEELRESRRRQLSIERDGIRAQLKLVTTSRERLESVIRTAEMLAYQQGADGSGAALNHAVIETRGWSFGWILGALGAVAEILGIVVLVILAIKRVRTT
jgi:hypothetical protein